MKDKFREIYKTNITRDGADKLWEYLESHSDFFSAPASSRFHGACVGGLLSHSIAVYEQLLKLKTDESDETIAICGLLHDLCKINMYSTATKNVKNELGVWEQVKYYTIDDKLCYGHGEGSVYIISSFIKLSRDEALAIRWHMCGFDNAAKGGDRSISGAYEKYPLCAKLAAADLLATYVDKL